MWRASGKLAVRATQGVMGLVQEMHRTIASGPAILGRPLERPVRALTDKVYGSLQGFTQLVGAGLDVVLTGLAPWLGESTPGPLREALLAALGAEAEDPVWRGKLRQLVCLGTPHHGAPLERIGSWVRLLLGVSPYSAPFVRLAEIRSAGVTESALRPCARRALEGE